nr:MAG TPA: repressor protein [Caudoviricetes sp.]
MDIVEKIRMLCNEKVMTIAELERNLGLGAGTVSRWNVRVPGADKIQKVANYFSVSTDYLLGLTDVPQWATPQDVLDIERALQLNSTIVAYDGIELTDDEKEQVDAIIRGVLWKHLKNKK